MKQWFDDQQIPYEAVNIFGKELKREDLMDIIVKSENGTDDIISNRSKIVQENNIDFDSMTISELITFIQKNPSILKRPIIVDDHRVQVGYNEDEISTFLPRAKRLAEQYCNPDCESFANCPIAKNKAI